jgi:hypothetical protein
MQDHSSDAPASGSTGVGRRAVVRTGVWTVPAVAVAVAAPAMAAHSGGSGKLTFDTFNVFGATFNGAGDATTLESQIQVQNEFVTGGPTLSTLSVSVTYPVGRVTGAAPTNLTGSGWAFASASKSGGAWRYTFTWSGTLASSKSTSTLDYRVARTDTASESVNLTAIAIATGVTSATASASTHLR